MARMAPEELAKKIGGGLLSFPVTHFTDAFEFDEAPYREHIEWLLQHAPQVCLRQAVRASSSR